MATFDPNIALQTRGLQDPLESYGKALTLKSLGQQQKMQEAQFAKYEQDQANETTLNDLYRSSVGTGGQLDRNALLSGAASRGLGSRIPGLQKGFADQDKAAGEAKKVSIETQAAGAKLISDAMARLASNPNVTHQDVINLVSQFPADVISPEQTAQIVRTLPPGPQLRQTLLMYGANADERLKALMPQVKNIDAGNRIIPGTQSPETGVFTPAPGAPITKAPEGYIVGPDGNLSVDPGFLESKKQIARAGKTDLNVSYGAPVAGVNDKDEPVFFQPAKGGGAPSIVSGVRPTPKPDKSLTEGQAKANLFGTRMGEADRIINELEAKGTKSPSVAQQLTGGTGLLGAAATAMAKPEQQQVDQAQRDFINAVLRRESGAAISAPEFENARRQYFVQPGDSPEVIAQKTANRKTATEGMLAEVPEKQRGVPSLKAKTSGPKPGTVESGYVFMGGDPADQKNWKKQ